MYLSDVQLYHLLKPDYIDANSNVTLLHIFNAPVSRLSSICVKPNESIIQHDKTISDLIDVSWENRANKAEYNGKLVKLKSITLADNLPLLEICHTDYKTFKVTADLKFKNYIDKANYAPFPLTVNVMIETVDNKIVLAKRTTNGKYWECPGGFVNTDDNDCNGDLDVLKSAQREVLEEIHHDIFLDEIQLLGFGASRFNLFIFLAIHAKSPLTYAQILNLRENETIQCYDEMKILDYLEINPDSFINAIKTSKLQRAALGSILIFGHLKFGQEWFKRALHVSKVTYTEVTDL